MHNPPINEVIDNIISNAMSNLAARFKRGTPDYGRLCEAHALAQKIDACLMPMLAHSQMSIQLVGADSPENLMERIRAADLKVAKITDKDIGHNNLQHEIELEGIDCRVVAYSRITPATEA